MVTRSKVEGRLENDAKKITYNIYTGSSKFIVEAHIVRFLNGVLVFYNEKDDVVAAFGNWDRLEIVDEKPIEKA